MVAASSSAIVATRRNPSLVGSTTCCRAASACRQCPGLPSGRPITPPASRTSPSSSSSPASTIPHDFERWNPWLTLVEEIPLSREPEIAQFPSLQRLYYRLQARSTSWSRKGTVILRYRFF
jgi:hypothetical protein